MLRLGRMYSLCHMVVMLSLPSWPQQLYATDSACLENTTEKAVHSLGDTRRSSRVKAPNSPLAGYYAQDAWEGTVLSRVEKLAREIPAIRVHKNVRFRYQGDDGVATFQNKTVVEIPAGVATDELRGKIHQALSRGVVSFPVDESGGHLYTRLGNKTFDQYNSFNTNDSVEYLKSVSESYQRSVLEPIVALRSSEELRLREYVKNVSEDSSKVLVRRGYYQGSGPGDTNRTLKDNAPLDPSRGHNCTSWICTSPIGEIDAQGKREALITMTKGPLADEVHTNPGWLNFHLTGRTSEERNPVVLFWPKAGDSAEARIGAGEAQSFKWDFDLH